jgi:peptide/nickel transport system substrate-binding protein
MDALVGRLAVETAPDARKALAAQFARLASSDVPIVPLVEIQSFTLAGKNVRNFTTGANVQGETLADVWLQA